MARVSVLGAGTVLCEHCELAESPLRRMRGLLGRRGLEPGEGILLRPAPAIHTCFMRFAIDVVFVDEAMEVVGVREQVGPWRFARSKGAKAVIELAAGEARRLGLAPGDRLLLSDPAGPGAGQCAGTDGR